MGKINILDIIINIIIIGSALIIVYWFFQLMSGGSPTQTQFNSMFVIMIIGALFKIYQELMEIKIDTKYSFIKMKEDVDLIKQKLKI